MALVEGRRKMKLAPLDFGEHSHAAAGFGRGAARAAFIASLVGILAGCCGSNTPSGQVTGEIEVRRSFPTCDVNVKFHNGTTFHLTDAGFNVTGYPNTLVVKNIAAGGEDSATMSVPIGYDGSSCLAIARKIEAHASDNNVGTCSMEGATEGECQKLFAFHSAISQSAIQGDIDQLKSGNLKIGDTVPLTGNYGRRVDVTTEIGGEKIASCSDDTLPTWAEAVEDIHRDGDGVADSYQVGGACRDGTTIHGWVERKGSNQ